MKKYNFTTQEVINYIEDYIEFDGDCIILNEEDWYDALGVQKSDIMDGDSGFLMDDVKVTFDGEELDAEEELACSVGNAMAKYGEEHFGGYWEFHWSEGVVAAWDANKTSAGEIWGF